MPKSFRDLALVQMHRALQHAQRARGGDVERLNLLLMAVQKRTLDPADMRAELRGSDEEQWKAVNDWSVTQGCRSDDPTTISRWVGVASPTRVSAGVRRWRVRYALKGGALEGEAYPYGANEAEAMQAVVLPQGARLLAITPA